MEPKYYKVDTEVFKRGEVEAIDVVTELANIDAISLSNDELRVKALASIEEQHAKRAAELLADKALLESLQ